MLLLMLVALLFAAVGYLIYRKEINGFCKSKKRLDGKTCLVTGGTRGIGLEVAIDFAARGARVIVACPFQDQGCNAQKKIIEESGNPDVVFKLLDLDDFHSVREFARDILKTENRLDILMNNAGMSVAYKYKSAPIDVEIPTVMRVHYLGHFLLTILLFPLLKKSGTPSSPSRIVNTISTMYWCGRSDVEKLELFIHGIFGKSYMYANSKLALVLFSRELPKRLPTDNVVINNADPGEVWSPIWFNCFDFNVVSLGILFRIFGKSVYEGAQTLLHAALDDKAGRSSGQVYRDCKARKLPPLAENSELGTKVWDNAVPLVELKDEELERAMIN